MVVLNIKIELNLVNIKGYLAALLARKIFYFPI